MRLPAFVYASKALLFPTLSQQSFSGDKNDGLLHVNLAELPGGSPFSLCPVSSSADLFSITSVELSRQPVHFDDEFTVHIYGTFQKTFAANATMKLAVDCGSHCDEYGAPPRETPGDYTTAGFCELSEIEQPLGGRRKKATCPPEEGYALLTSYGYVMPMFFQAPGWYNFTFDATTIEGKRIYCLTTEVCLRWEDPEKNKRYPPGPWSDCRWPR